jgi:hypothetical protein
MEAKKVIEGVVLGSALVVSLGGLMVVPMDAHAVVACNLSTTGAGSTVAGNNASFIKVGFNPKCSPNTFVDYVQDSQAVAVKGASQKGSIVFGATSEGGGGAKSCATGSAAVPPTVATSQC